MEETCTCCVCESECNEEEVKHIEIKGNVKNICKECAASVSGLL